MIHFMAWQLVKAVEMLKGIYCNADFVISFDKNQRDEQAPDGIVTETKSQLLYCRTQCERIELTAALNRIMRFEQALRGGITFGEIRNQAKILLETIDSELCYRRFAFVPSDKAALLDKIEHDWKKVWSAFDKAQDDTQEAIKCYALGRNTACVFHLMRVAEHGLRRLAKRLGVTLVHKGQNHPLEYADWDKVITGIKNKIAVARTLPHGKKRADTIQFFSDAADHCSYMKDIWRNEVSHARRRYTDVEALAALTRVHGFMELLTTRI